MILDILKKIFHFGAKVTDVIDVIEETTQNIPSISKKDLAINMLHLLFKTQNMINVPDVINNFVVEANVFLKKYNGIIEFSEEGDNNIIKITYPKIGGMQKYTLAPDSKAAQKPAVSGQITDPIPNECNPDTRGL